MPFRNRGASDDHSFDGAGNGEISSPEDKEKERRSSMHGQGVADKRQEEALRHGHHRHGELID